MLREQLEKDRRELFEKEKRLRQLGGAVPVSDLTPQSLYNAPSMFAHKHEKHSDNQDVNGPESYFLAYFI